MNAADLMRQRLVELQAAYTATEREHQQAQAQTAALARSLVQLEAAFNEAKFLQGRLTEGAPLQVVPVDGSDGSDLSDTSDKSDTSDTSDTTKKEQ